jgi:hypothetical protein
MNISEKMFGIIQEELKRRNIKLTDWLLEQDIIIPDIIPTFDVDEIKPLGQLETRQPKNVKPNYSEIFQNTVNINDGIYDFTFYQNENKLYNKAGVELGIIEDMFDRKSIIPKSYKNSDNKVIHTKTGEVLKAYIIYPGFSFYHSIPPKKYKTFKYDFELDRLIPTNFVTINPLKS